MYKTNFFYDINHVIDFILLVDVDFIGYCLQVMSNVYKMNMEKAVKNWTIKLKPMYCDEKVCSETFVTIIEFVCDHMLTRLRLYFNIQNTLLCIDDFCFQYVNANF